MAIVVVQVGQCGNQLGDELFTQLAISVASARETDPYVDSPFFCSDGMARCVLVDSEPKVVHGVRARHDTFIRADNVVCGQSGRGNNWGLGFYGLKETEENSAASPLFGRGAEAARQQQHRRSSGSSSSRGHQAQQPGFQKIYKAQRTEDGKLLSKALRAIHMETRRTADCPKGFEAILLLHSLAGGTGSGLASRLAEKIRYYFVEPPEGQYVDERKESAMVVRDGLDGMLVEKRRARYLVNIAVAPQACGELALQGINAALTLHTMHKYADATILLRNDDVMTPSGAVTRSATQTTNIIQRCLTFKEANEVLVAMLLPVLQYGILPGSGGHRRRDPQRDNSHRNTHARAAAGVMASILENCCPVLPYEKLLRVTGGNTMLTLLPTPQNTYEGYKGAILRCVFFTVAGGKAFLPGCAASLPMPALCARAATAAYTLENAETVTTSTSRGTQAARRGRGGVGQRRELPPWNSSTGRTPKKRDKDVWDDDHSWDDGEVGEASDGNDNGEEKREWLRGDDSRGGDRAQERKEGGAVYTEIATTIPALLLAYYREVKRSPVAHLSASLEGVAVVNQARELNRALMFPLLRSAALKVSVGAFLYTYEKAGVSQELIVRAYQDVAEVLSTSEAL